VHTVSREMSDANARSSRLIDALECLVDEESILVREGNFEQLPSVQDRIGDVLGAIIALPVNEQSRSRIFPVVQRRESTRLELARLARGVGSELNRVHGARNRLRGFAPAYTPGARSGSKFVSAA
jgi:hypothetical protein